MKQDSKYFDISVIDDFTFNFILSPRSNGKQYVIERMTKKMDKDTLKQITEYCMERAKASKDIEDKLYQELQNYENHSYYDTDLMDLRNKFYMESGKITAFLEIVNKLKDIKEY